MGEHALHQGVEAVEHREGADEGQRGQRHPAHADGRDDVDGAHALTREEVAPRDVVVEGILHFFSNSSMCSR